MTNMQSRIHIVKGYLLRNAGSGAVRGKRVEGSLRQSLGLSPSGKGSGYRAICGSRAEAARSVCEGGVKDGGAKSTLPVTRKDVRHRG